MDEVEGTGHKETEIAPLVLHELVSDFETRVVLSEVQCDHQGCAYVHQHPKNYIDFLLEIVERGREFTFLKI
jgi:hypothetical protein